MASGLFTSYKNALWGTGSRTDWDTATVKASIIDSADVTISLTTHDFQDDIAAGTVASGTIATPSISGGAVDGADVTLTTVTGDTCEQVVIWEDTGGAASTDPLLILFDAGGFTSGMPVTPNGGNITITWNASGIATF